MEQEYISITEASILTGKHITTIYKGIKQGRIQYKTVEDNNKTVKKVLKSDILKLFGNEYKTTLDQSIRPSNTQVEDGIRLAKDDMKQVIEEVLEAKQSQLMKPIEEQALYRLGRIEQENSFLKAKVETLLQELEQYKSLPGPADVEKIQKENQEKEKDLIIQIEMERKEKEDLKSISETIQKETEEKNRRKLSELETRQKEQDELHRQELKQAWKQTEEEGKNYLATIEELKKRLEAEEKKPWYRKLFS
jgi:hypothetical protein